MNPECPECEKLLAVSEESQVIGEFLEWLQSGEADDFPGFARSVFLAAHRVVTERGDMHTGEPLDEDEYHVSDNVIDPFRYTIEGLLAKFFKIDLRKVETERRRLLDSLREDG